MNNHTEEVGMSKKTQSNDPTNELAEGIVALARSGAFEGADVRDAVLLAQHRLFGSEYMNRHLPGDSIPTSSTSC